jgi:hypothetical protein
MQNKISAVGILPIIEVNIYTDLHANLTSKKFIFSVLTDVGILLMCSAKRLRIFLQRSHVLRGPLLSVVQLSCEMYAYDPFV